MAANYLLSIGIVSAIPVRLITKCFVSARILREYDRTYVSHAFMTNLNLQALHALQWPPAIASVAFGDILSACDLLLDY